MKFLFSSAVLFLFVCRVKNDPDYFWRPYFGNIPNDAIPGGLDSSGRVTYIGQAFVANHGLLVGQIVPGTKSITTSQQGIHVSSAANKILCSNHQNYFRWMRANSRTLQLAAINEHLVVGGTEWGKELSIGRIKYQGDVVVGKVCSGEVGEAKLYFPYGGTEIKTDDYEILIYNDTLVDAPAIY